MSSPNDGVLRGFSRSLRARNRSPRTIQSYLEAANLLVAHVGDADLDSLTRSDIESFIEDQLRRHSPSTAAVRFRSVQQLFKWMVAEEVITASPLATLTAPTVPEQPVPVIPDDHLRLLLKACDGKEFLARRDTAIVRLFNDGGMRVGELIGMSMDDADFDFDVARVVGKGARQRSVPFGDKTAIALDRYLRVRAKHPAAKLDALWIGNRNAAMTTSGITQMLKRRALEAGIGPLHPHQFRHTAAHQWMSMGGGETEAMRLFGWKSRDMLSRYGSSVADERAKEAHRRLRPGDRI